MGTLMARANVKKAKARTRKGANQTRKALQDGAKAARDLAAALRAQAQDAARDAGVDERVDDLAHRAEELAARIRDSDATHRAEAWAADMAEKVKSSETTKQAIEQARRYGDDGAVLLGGWLSSGKRGKTLGLAPRKRRVPGWLLLLGGLAAGYGIASMMSRQPSGQDYIGVAPMPTPTSAGGDLASEVRTKLGSDPRLGDLTSLNINVAEGTVFVRGSLPSAVTEDEVRELITAVPGVRDVDLQVGASA